MTPTHPPSNGRTDRLILAALIYVAVMSGGSITYLAVLGLAIPDALVASLAAAVGALVGRASVRHPH